MQPDSPIETASLGLPPRLAEWIGDASIFESSGCSGAQTVYIGRDSGAFLKIAPRGALRRAAQMQAYWAERQLSAEVLMYLSEDRDYLLTAPVPGSDGIAAAHLAQPERLCKVFGRALRQLHEADFSDCPVDLLSELLDEATRRTFQQWHLDDLRPFIGAASAERAAAEVEAGRHLLQRDALLHGDYCLPNVMLDDWQLSGFIDVAEGGVGDRHYDIAWGLWTIQYNLKNPAYGELFLDAYGRDPIDADRLRICALLASME